MSKFNRFYLTETPSEIQEIITILSKKFFTKKNTDITYRALNHYYNENLINENRHDNKKWRKFDGIELIWIFIINSLRNYGVSLKNIKILKENIFEKGNLGNIDKAYFINRSFEQEIAFSILEKYNLYLLIFSDFSYTFHDDNSLQQWTNKSYKNESHINVPLTNIIFETWKKLKPIS